MRANPFRRCTALIEMEAKMQEEANQKTVGIAVQGTKMTGRVFLSTCEKYLQYRKEQKRLKQQRREPDLASYEINQPKRVRVDRLLREGEGVSTVTIKDNSIKPFERLAREALCEFLKIFKKGLI